MLCSDSLAKHYINTHPEKEQVWLLAAIADYSNEIEKHFGVNNETK
jgi:lipocalin